MELISAVLKNHEQEIHTLDRRVETVEQRTMALQTVAEFSGGRIRTLEDQVQGLQEQVDDLEDRSRKKTLRLMGLPGARER
ncbi:hypothetical protein chiPu_0014850 [Chiloscyllium punctatum]|uniref:Uncharacterized protein n=1 Tax=Chiloscyllium punctatum TaxID=137246 RepID=A0A401T129_CHIPU|nr:hypothetical protein [Chiloscyllium punctatum]